MVIVNVTSGVCVGARTQRMGFAVALITFIFFISMVIVVLVVVDGDCHAEEH